MDQFFCISLRQDVPDFAKVKEGSSTYLICASNDKFWSNITLVLQVPTDACRRLEPIQADIWHKARYIMDIAPFRPLTNLELPVNSTVMGGKWGALRNPA